jgi:SAM-dependent methyltransferase
LPRDTAPFYSAYPVHQRKSGAFQAVRRVLMSRVYYRPAAGTRVLLDYGCGDGTYLQQVRRPGSRCVGYEPDPRQAEAAALLAVVPVYSDVAQLLERYASAVDVVTMHSVLEHVTSLHDTFRLAARLLRRGGVLYVVVPQANCHEARLFGRKWHALDPPRHISFPEPPVVRRLAAAHGMRVRRQEAIPFPTTLAGTIPNLLLGRFSFAVMAASLPFTLPFTLIDPGSVRAFTLEKQ